MRAPWVRQVVEGMLQSFLTPSSPGILNMSPNQCDRIDYHPVLLNSVNEIKTAVVYCFHLRPTFSFCLLLCVCLFLEKTECGSAFTSKLEGMFKDIDLSRDLMTTYSHHLKTKLDDRTVFRLDKSREMDLHVQVTFAGRTAVVMMW